ncbi:MAG: FAD-dependent oxidoreductase, partial [Candidatus Xenobia bacterium]
YDRPGDKRPYVQVYVDGANSEYWEGLQNPADPGVTTRLCASPQLAAELQHQLEELHGHPLPAPNGFLYKRWADPFLGAAYHTWNAGSQPSSTSDAMVQPMQNLPLYVVGEAFSTTQGWIEGALQQAEKALDKIGVARG